MLAFDVDFGEEGSEGRRGEDIERGRERPVRETRGVRWRRMSRKQRDRLMAAVAAIQTGLDDLAGDVLDEVLLPEHRDFLHPQDLRTLQRERCRRETGV